MLQRSPGYILTRQNHDEWRAELAVGETVILLAPLLHPH